MGGLAEMVLDHATGQITSEIKGAISDEISGLGFSDIQSDIIENSISRGLAHTSTGEMIIGIVIPHVGGIVADRIVAEINHITGIENLDFQDFPGFESEYFELPSGQIVIINTDATPYLDGDSPKTYVIDSTSPNYAYVNQSKLSSEDQAALDARIQQIEHGAMTDIYNHANANGGVEGYYNDLRDEIGHEEQASLELQGTASAPYTRSAGDAGLTAETEAAGVQIAAAAIPSQGTTGPDLQSAQTFSI